MIEYSMIESLSISQSIYCMWHIFGSRQAADWAGVFMGHVKPFFLDDMEIHEMAKRIRKKRKINKIEARLEDKTCGRSKLVRKNKVRNY